MSYFDYLASRAPIVGDAPFNALIMAAMRRADTRNLALLRAAFPEVHAELEARSGAPGGVLPDDPGDGDPGDQAEQLLTYDEAVALLPDGDRVHTFLDGGALVGADWDRAKILDLLATAERREVTGLVAQSYGHGLAAYREDGVPVFIKTRATS